MTAVAMIESHLAEARRARAEDDLGAARHALAEAVACADRLGDLSWVSITRWRSAKAAFDQEDPAGALTAIEPLLQLDEPFADYAGGLKAVGPMTRLAWDQLGYGDRRPERLWQAWTAHHRRIGDPFLAAMGEVHAAWPLACRGELDALSALLERWAAVTPRRFGSGPHRHAEAPDTPASVFWVQRDVARTVLRGATWAGADRLAWLAWEALEDAMEDTGGDRTADYWFLESVARAGLRFGWEDALSYLPPWEEAAARLEHPRADLHRALTAGELSRHRGDPDTAREHFLAAVLAVGDSGPEWLADALREAARCGAATLPDLDEVIHRRGLHAFTREGPEISGSLPDMED